MNRARIKLILFDFDETLTNELKVRYVDPENLRELGCSAEQVEKIMALDKEFAKFYSGEISKDIDTLEKEIAIHAKHYRHFLSEAGVNKSEVERVLQGMFDNRMSKVSFGVDKKTYAFLKKLRRNYKTAIVSNALPSRVREIESTGLERYVDKVYISNLIGLFKPNLDIYEYVAKDFGVDLNEMILIDDKLGIVEKTAELGIPVVLIDQKGKYEKPEFDFPVIRNLSEIGDLGL